MLPRDFTSLEQIKIASPCPAEWRFMRGDHQVRHCTHCARNVYNLSEMTRHEALTLILRTEGHVCVRFYRRADGTVMTKDCGRIEKMRKRFAVWSAALAGALGITSFVSWLSHEGDRMGDAGYTPTGKLGYEPAHQSQPSVGAVAASPDQGVATIVEPPFLTGKPVIRSRS